MLLDVTLLAMLVAGAAQAAPAAAPPLPDACTLLTASEIRAVQKVAVKETKGSASTLKAEQYAQCVYATSDFAHSVSLTIIRGNTGDPGTRAYWKRTFEQRDAREADKVKRAEASGRTRSYAPTRRVDDIGEDAYWSGDGKAGSLYVLAGDKILRVSVGGVADPDERLRRTRTLAEHALRRLRG